MKETQKQQNEAMEETTRDAEQLQEHIDRLKSEQNLGMGTLGGLTGAILGALAWAGITVATGHQVGYMAVGVGYLAGMGMRTMGKGITPIFGYVGAILALFGCFLGNFFTLIHYCAQQEAISYIQTLTAINYSSVLEIMWQIADFITFIFYALAIYEGYHFSFRYVSEKELVT